MSLESHRACLWVIELQIQPCNSLTTWQNSAKEQPQDCGLCNQYLDSTFARDLNWRRLLSLDCRVDIHNKNTLRRLSVPPYGSPSGPMIWSKSGFMTTKQLTQKHYIDGLWIDYWLLMITLTFDVAHNLPRWTWAKHGSSSAGHPCSLQLRGDALSGKICASKLWKHQWPTRCWVKKTAATGPVLRDIKQKLMRHPCCVTWFGKGWKVRGNFLQSHFIDLVVMENQARTLSTEP